MLLAKAIVLSGIAVSSAFALSNDLDTTLSTKYIEHQSSGVETTYSTSWRSRKAIATTKINEDDAGWTVVSSIQPTSTEAQQTTIVNDTSSRATHTVPNNAIVAHRMVMFAGENWVRFTKKPDDETDVS
jgi:hypothetical protein